MNKASPGQSPQDQPVLRLSKIARHYAQGDRVIDVFSNVSLDLYPGELVALLGPSGAGKSTLLHIAGLLEAPDEGSVEIAGRPCTGLNDRQRTAIRRNEIGFIYQFHHLLPEFSALENVMLAQMIAGATKAEARLRAHSMLVTMGLVERTSHRPGELSGGEQQRVAIARALANNPRVILADEPTGNLDPRTAERVFGEFLEHARAHGVSGIVATHNHALARSLDRVMVMEDGALVIHK